MPTISEQIDDFLSVCESIELQGVEYCMVPMATLQQWRNEAEVDEQAMDAISDDFQDAYGNEDTDGQGGDSPPHETEYEFRVTYGPRKAWDGEPDLSKEGWEEYREWERFDYHEERYWRRPLKLTDGEGGECDVS